MSMAQLIKSLTTLSAAQAGDGAAAPAAAPVTTTPADGAAPDAAAAAAAAPDAEAQAAAAAAAAQGGDAAAAAAPAAPVVVLGTGAAAAAVAAALGVSDLGKSITLELEGGEEVLAFDGAELFKSLAGIIDGNSTETEKALGLAVMAIATQSSQIAAMNKSFADATEQLAKQNETITALRSDLDEVRQQPAGRKSTTVAPVQAGAALNKSLDGGADELQPQEFLAKCLDLQKAGKLGLQEVAIAEAAIGSGVDVPAHIKAVVFSKP